MDEPRFRARGPGWVEGIAPAKLNLFLEVVGKRPDGYHDLATVFHEIDLGDELRVTLTPGAASDTLELRGLAIDGEVANNLAIRAARSYRVRRPRAPCVHIALDKRVPPGTGMGGGSADAAFVLSAMEHLVEPLDASERASVARELGADVGFLLRGGTAIGRGRGDELEPLDITGPFTFVLALSPFSISTALAYSQVDLNGPRRDVSSCAEGLGNAKRGIAAFGCFNRLEDAACRVAPRLRETLQWLREITGRVWVMTGSGSAIFTPMMNESGHESDAVALCNELKGRRELDLRIVRSFDRHQGKQCT